MDRKQTRALIKGCLSYVPGSGAYLLGKGGGTQRARYCYSVWFRHLLRAHAGPLRCYPRTVVEIGPGDSLGAGFAALLGGADVLYALDVVRYATVETNLAVFDELVELFQKRADLPNDTEAPSVYPKLPSYRFPAALLPEEQLRAALAPERVARLRRAITEGGSSELHYVAPWQPSSGSIPQRGVDFIFSQTALEYVENLESLLEWMRAVLRSGGMLSHEIDFSALQTSDTWNRHWTFGRRRWRLMRGRNPEFPNRLPHSAYLKLFNASGFRVTCDEIARRPSSFSRTHLAAACRDVTDDDLCCHSALIQATTK